VCHESISSLKILNDDLNTKLEVANKSSSCVEHVVICNICEDFDVNACNEHLMPTRLVDTPQLRMGLAFERKPRT
jgi:hypothetical protein